MALVPRVVVITRKTDYERLLYRHGTREQARFFLHSRGRTLEEVEQSHALFEAALQAVSQAIPMSWRRTRVGRVDLDRFLFEPDDIVVAIGQDGLVANMAKYLDGQPVIGVNPDPQRYDGILVPHPPTAVPRLMDAVGAGRLAIEPRSMVAASVDDGQQLLALNEVFIGHRSHQSARYRIAWEQREERHSSSGIIVSSGTGSTGWARSISRERGTPFPLPGPRDEQLSFFVREAFPSVATGTDITQGLIGPGQALQLISELHEGGVIFADGIEADRIEFHWGMCVTLTIAERQLHLVGESV